MARYDVIDGAASARTAANAIRNISRTLKVAAVKVGMVEKVKEVKAELDAIPLFDLPVLRQLHVNRSKVCTVARSTPSRAYRTYLVAH